MQRHKNKPRIDSKFASKREFFFIKWDRGGFLYKIGLKGEFFIGMNIPQ